MNRELTQLLQALEFNCRFPDLAMAESLCDKLHTFSDADLREFLHSVPGLGQENCDVVMLYVFGRPVFPVDASLYRVLVRHRLIADDADYFAVQDYCAQNISEASEMQMQHQRLQFVGKTFCKKSAPDCEHCPLREVNGGPHLDDCG